MAEYVVRRGSVVGYSVVENRHVRRLDLSAGARGVLAWLLTLGDGWKLQTEDFYRRFPKDSQRAVDEFKRELKAVGYLRIVPIVDGGGRGAYRGSRYVVDLDGNLPKRRDGLDGVMDRELYQTVYEEGGVEPCEHGEYGYCRECKPVEKTE